MSVDALPSGVLAAVPTFFRDDESLELPPLRSHLSRLAEAGVRGVLVCGSTGEFPVLSVDERMAVADFVVSQAAALGISVLVHAGAASTRESVQLARHAVSMGAHGVAAITPYYLPVDGAAMAVHLRRIKEAIGDVPLLAYSFPARAGTEYPLEVLSTLAGDGVLSGVKESGGDLQRLLDVRARCGPSFRVYAGAVELLPAAVARGMDGGILALANAAPAELVRAYDLADAGELDAAEAVIAGLAGVREAASLGLMPAGLKAVLAALHGLPAASRTPRLPLTPAELARLTELLAGVAAAG